MHRFSSSWDGFFATTCFVLFRRTICEHVRVDGLPRAMDRLAWMRFVGGSKFSKKDKVAEGGFRMSSTFALFSFFLFSRVVRPQLGFSPSYCCMWIKNAHS